MFNLLKGMLLAIFVVISVGFTTSAQAQESDECNPRSRLEIGMRAQVADATPDPLNLHRRPDYDSRVLREIPVNRWITVTDGPECDGDEVWWETTYRGSTGWVTEINSANHFDLDVPVVEDEDGNECNTIMRLSIGARGRVSDVTPDPLPLRSGPSSSNRVLVEVPVNRILRITDGPICQRNLVWWETTYRGQTGWVAEINGYDNRNLILVSD
jgi:hypothetical protein